MDNEPSVAALIDRLITDARIPRKELVDTQSEAARRLAFFVRAIGLSGLFVSGVGVLAMAWLTVRDRTREIGTRRALGATAVDVFLQFAFEALVLASLGAIAGVALGWVTSHVAAARAELPFVFEIRPVILALGSSVVLNLAFSAWPALRAARLDPIHALRYE